MRDRPKVVRACRRQKVNRVLGCKLGVVKSVAKHLRIVEEQYRADLLVSDAKGFFVDLEVFGSPPVEPSIGTDASRTTSVFMFSEQGRKRKALVIQFLFRKPTLGYARRPSEPSASRLRMGHEHDRKTVCFSDLHYCSSETCIESFGNLFRGLESGSRQCFEHRFKEISRQKKVRRILVGDSLRIRGGAPSVPDVVRPADEAASSVMMPMPQFMGDRKSLSSGRRLGIDGDDRPIASSDDPRFARVQFANVDPSAQFPSDGLQINIFGAIYPEVL